MAFLKKLRDCSFAVFAIIVLVSILMACGVVQFDGDLFWKFIVGAVIFVVGQALFLMSAQTGIMQMGHSIGSNISKFKRGSVVYIIVLLIAFSLTLAEPDIQLYLQEVSKITPSISSFLLLLFFAFGVALFAIFGIFKVTKHIKLKYILLGGYLLIFLLIIFMPAGYLGFSFDASGVTTGAITVPVLLTLMSGISGLKAKNSQDDSFGLVGIASFGPIFVVLIIGLIVGHPDDSLINMGSNATSFLSILGDSAWRSLIAFVPICIVFLVVNFIVLKLPKRQIARIFISVLFSFVGLVLFFVGIYFGFAGMADHVGEQLGNFVNNNSAGWVLILAFMAVLGLTLVFTEPSIGILANQIRQVTNGFIKKRVYLLIMGIGMSIALILGALKIIFEINILYILIPVLVIILLLSFFVQEIFVGIALDTGASASGSMLVAFVFPILFAIASTIGVSIFDYAFGVIALVATIPIITVELLGLSYKIKLKRRKKDAQMSDNRTNEQ